MAILNWNEYYKYIFTLFRLPAAWLTGVQLAHLDEKGTAAILSTDGLIKTLTIMFWAVQEWLRIPTGYYHRSNSKIWT